MQSSLCFSRSFSAFHKLLCSPKAFILYARMSIHGEFTFEMVNYQHQAVGQAYCVKFITSSFYIRSEDV